MAFSVGANAVISAAPPIPSAAPRSPPSTPWTSDSPVIWRTTRRCGHPSAFSVPSSRVRLATEDSVSRLAIRNAAARATIASAVPSLFDRFFASTSEPDTRSARSLAVVTWAPANERRMELATAPTELESVARTWSTFTRPSRPESFWSSSRRM